MSETATPPHDQVMTWGEFRRAARAMSAFQSLLTLYSTVGIASATDEKAQERVKELERQIEATAKEFERALGFSPDEALNG